MVPLHLPKVQGLIVKSNVEPGRESNNSSGSKQKQWEGSLSLLPVPPAPVTEAMMGPCCRLENAFFVKYSNSQAGPDQQQNNRLQHRQSFKFQQGNNLPPYL